MQNQNNNDLNNTGSGAQTVHIIQNKTYYTFSAAIYWISRLTGILTNLMFIGLFVFVPLTIVSLEPNLSKELSRNFPEVMAIWQMLPIEKIINQLLMFTPSMYIASFVGLLFLNFITSLLNSFNHRIVLKGKEEIEIIVSKKSERLRVQNFAGFLRQENSKVISLVKKNGELKPLPKILFPQKQLDLIYDLQNQIGLRELTENEVKKMMSKEVTSPLSGSSELHPKLADALNAIKNPSQFPIFNPETFTHLQGKSPEEAKLLIRKAFTESKNKIVKDYGLAWIIVAFLLFFGPVIISLITQFSTLK